MWGFLFVLGGLFLLSSEDYTLFESYLYFDDLFTTNSMGMTWIVFWKFTRCEVLPCMVISKILGIMVQKTLVKMNVCGMLSPVPPIVAWVPSPSICFLNLGTEAHAA